MAYGRFCGPQRSTARVELASWWSATASNVNVAVGGAPPPTVAATMHEWQCARPPVCLPCDVDDDSPGEWVYACRTAIVCAVASNNASHSSTTGATRKRSRNAGAGCGKAMCGW